MNVVAKIGTALQTTDVTESIYTYLVRHRFCEVLLIYRKADSMELVMFIKLQITFITLALLV